ncbi:MAG: tail fiber domain-containing protein, partial [Terriglobales bacterium]
MRRAFVSLFVGVVLLAGAAAIAQDVQSQNNSQNTSSKVVVPRLIRFSGALKDGAGKPHTGITDITFSLYREEGGGEALWFETQTVEADAQGRYTVLLGAMHPEGLPVDLFTSGEARWLGVSVGKLPEQARVLLVSVPYALKAGDAETLAGKPATAFVASDQLKDQVRSEVKTQVTQTGSATRTLVGTAPSPQSLGEGQSSFLCNLAADCVAVTQSGTGVG